MKLSEVILDNNFGNCGALFKILSPINLLENSLCTHHKDFYRYLTCSMSLHYLVKVENLKCIKKYCSKYTVTGLKR